MADAHLVRPQNARLRRTHAARHGSRRDASAHDTENTQANPLEHSALKFWRELRHESAEPSGIQVLKRRPKSTTYKLEGIGLGGSAVIAKRCLQETAWVERIVYEEILPHLPSPRLHYYGFVAEDAEFCWLFLEDAGDKPSSAQVKRHRVAAARWLGLMHKSLAGSRVGDRLPRRDPEYYMEEMRSAGRTILESLGNPLLNADDLAVLETIISQFEVLESHWDEVAAFCGRMPQTLVHGDFAQKNVRIRHSNGGIAFLSFDWENAGWGTPAVDFAQFAVNSVTPDIATYCSVVRRSFPDVHIQDMGTLANFGTVFRLIEAICWERYGILYEYWPSHEVADRYSKWSMSELRAYQAWMTSVLRAAKWGD